jgi:hypothetical protein
VPTKTVMRLRRLAGALCLSIAALGASSAHASPYLPPAGKVFAGVSGSITAEDSDVPVFSARAGKHAAVIQTFTAWDYNYTRYLRNAARHQARVMVHISTKGGDGREAITPRGIAMGHGDAHLVHLTRAFADSGQVVYVRIMAEMNGSWNPYSAYGPGYKGGAHSTKNFRQAWRRMVLITRGGPVDQINARLHRLGLPSVRGASGALPRPKVAFLFVPEVSGDPPVAGNSPRAYYPGSRYVDWVGTDFYSKFPNYSGLNAFYKEFPHKPFVFGEWALWGQDNPGFVHGLFGWIKSHRRVQMVMYNQGSHPSASPFELSHYPRSAAELRRQLSSPLFAPLAPEFN